MKRLLTIILVVSFWEVNESKAQQLNLDSLWGVWEDESQADSNRFSAVNRLLEFYAYSQPDSAIYFAQLYCRYARTKNNKKAEARGLYLNGVVLSMKSEYTEAQKLLTHSLQIQQEISDKKGASSSLNSLGIIYWNQGVYEKAIEHLNQGLTIDTELGDEEGIATKRNNIALIHKDQGNYSEAIDYFLSALSTFEEIGYKRGIAYSRGNIGMIYQDQGEDSKALDFYSNALSIAEEIEDMSWVASMLNNIGLVYRDRDDYAKALDFFTRSLTIEEELADKIGVAVALNNIGAVYADQGNYTKAVKYHFQSLEIANEIKDLKEKTTSLTSIAIGYIEQGDQDLGFQYALKAIKAAKQLGSPREIKPISEVLYQQYKNRGSFDKALEMYELHIQMRDSIMSEENQREVLRQEYKYEYEKEALADSLVFAKKEALSQAEIKRKNQQRNAFIAGFILMIGLAGVSFRSYQVKKRDNGIITAQKEEVEHKNEEIMASINYAKKLQTAVLPPARVVKDFFADSFLLYLPRDIVSGDFYWMESQGEVSYFAVADCTGHGVPGAMLSVIGMNGLNRALNEQKLTEPKDILTSLSEHVQRHFEQSESTVRDGMDICLCALDNKTKKLTFSGANNPVWIARAGEMHILKPDRRAIGHHSTDTQFTQQEFQLQDGDTIYLSSDGYQDQLGGSKGYKLMTKVFREKLLKLSTEPLDKQRETLLADLESWKGTHHQTDDICVMGIRV